MESLSPDITLRYATLHYTTLMGLVLMKVKYKTLGFVFFWVFIGYMDIYLILRLLVYFIVVHMLYVEFEENGGLEAYWPTGYSGLW